MLAHADDELGGAEPAACPRSDGHEVARRTVHEPFAGERLLDGGQRLARRRPAPGCAGRAA